MWNVGRGPFLGLMVCLIAIVAMPVRAGTSPAKGTASGLSLERLKELELSKLTPVERASLGLRLYRDEMVRPTPRPTPPYTDFKTHDYVLAQITRKLAEVDADTATLRHTWEGLQAGEVKDSLAIFLVLRGEVAAKDAVTTYVTDRSKAMRLRELGVTGLGKLAVKTQDAKIGDVLAQVLREDTQGQYKSSGKETVLVYPVRRAAKEAIQSLDKAGVLLPSYVTQAAERAQVEVKAPVRKAPQP